MSRERGALNDDYELDEDTTDLLPVLDNDSLPDIGLAITGISIPDQGGTVEAVEGGIQYTPAQDFFGIETFTYDVEDQSGNTDSAMVTVAVISVNDPPPVQDDEETVVQGEGPFPLNVLDNDGQDNPDGEEAITIALVGDPDQGGQVAIGDDETSLIYSPRADFTGTETFSYTARDENGGTAQATVMVTVDATEKLVRFALQPVNEAGQPIARVSIGESFGLQVTTEDLRADAQGVGSAYLDVTYDLKLASIEGVELTFGDNYEFVQNFEFTTDDANVGRVDEAGAVAFNATGAGPVELFTVPLQAIAEGEISFGTDRAEGRAARSRASRNGIRR